MTAEVAAPRPTKPLADGTGAIIVTLVYGLLGPILGGALIAPIAALAAGDLKLNAFLTGLLAMLFTFPMSFLIAYYSAGLVALATGVIVAAAVRRRRRTPFWLALVAPIAVFSGFAALNRISGSSIPGAAALGGAWGTGALLLLLVTAVAASSICWLLTLPVQWRMR